MATYLDFEYKIKFIQEDIISAQVRHDEHAVEELKISLDKAVAKIYKNLSDFQKLQLARHLDRPYALDYINLIMPIISIIILHNLIMYKKGYKMFSENLKKYRKISGMTQEELANKINILLNSNYTKNNVQSWERGVNPKIDVISAIAEILEITEQYLFDDSEKDIAL